MSRYLSGADLAGILSLTTSLPLFIDSLRDRRDAEDLADGHPGEHRGYGTGKCRKCGGRISLNKEYHLVHVPVLGEVENGIQ